MRAQIAVTGTLAVALAIDSFGAMPAQAAPVFAPQEASGPAIAPAGVTEVQYRRGWRGGHHHGHGRGWGRGIGPFLGGLAAGAIVGGALSRSYGYDGGGGGEDGVSLALRGDLPLIRSSDRHVHDLRR